MTIYATAPGFPLLLEFTGGDDEIDAVAELCRSMMAAGTTTTINLNGETEHTRLLVNFGNFSVMTVSDTDPEIDPETHETDPELEPKIRYKTSLALIAPGK